MQIGVERGNRNERDKISGLPFKTFPIEAPFFFVFLGSELFWSSTDELEATRQ